jgi:hypothetical protein
MSWPPPTSGSFFIQGTLTTIRWGTGGVHASYIVVSCTPAEEIETLYVENGTGIKVTRIILWQGRRVNITVVDDSTVTPPKTAQTITLFDPLGGGSGSLNFTVIENSYNAARKEAGQRVIVAEFLTGVEGAGSPPTEA